MSDTTATWTPTPITSLETVTGQVRTVTVTPTVPPTSGSSTGITKTNSGGLSLSAAVGLTVGLVVLAAILVSLAYFCWQRRQKEKEREYNDASGHRIVGGMAPSRTMSESSRYVLNTDGRQVVESWEGDDDLVGSRRSRLMATVDPRLDPFAKVYQRAGDSKSRESFNTIRDDQDYSRRINQAGPILRATNPDPDTALDR
jgi:cell wall integrity and stress response component